MVHFYDIETREFIRGIDCNSSWQKITRKSITWYKDYSWIVPVLLLLFWAVIAQIPFYSMLFLRKEVKMDHAIFKKNQAHVREGVFSN